MYGFLTTLPISDLSSGTQVSKARMNHVTRKTAFAYAKNEKADQLRLFWLLFISRLFDISLVSILEKSSQYLAAVCANAALELTFVEQKISHFVKFIPCRMGINS